MGPGLPIFWSLAQSQGWEKVQPGLWAPPSHPHGPRMAMALPWADTSWFRASLPTLAVGLLSSLGLQVPISLPWPSFLSEFDWEAGKLGAGPHGLGRPSGEGVRLWLPCVAPSWERYPSLCSLGLGWDWQSLGVGQDTVGAQSGSFLSPLPLMDTVQSSPLRTGSAPEGTLLVKSPPSFPSSLLSSSFWNMTSIP